MPEGPDGKTIIIVKKVVGHGGHHGGAWKVAYADFVTAMMALFLTLWLVNTASVQTKEAIASYFKRPGVFERGSGTPIEIGGAGILPDTFAPPADALSQIMQHKRIYETELLGQRGKEGTGGTADEEKELEKIAQEIEEQISKKSAAGEMEGLLGEVSIQVDQRGLVIEIMDTPKASMFRSGSSKIEPDAEKELLAIASTLSQLPNPIDIEGHTDARPFRSKSPDGYDNWDLSTDRANSARRVLERAGIQNWQIARVVGYADQRLKVPSDPFAPGNRRITISMRYTTQAAAALSSAHAQETKSVPIKRPGTVAPPARVAKPKRLPSELLRDEPAAGATEEAPSVLFQPFVATEDDLFETPEPKSSTEPRDVAPSPAPLGARETAGGLQVEISTQLPEGAQIEQADTAPSRPAYIEKDKIFDDRNPFFGR
ncbi:MAG: OmpA family protein [Bdellovibrionales bacterium]|nr:OmpA family protein [Bdellovibrionales bacterium]